MAAIPETHRDLFDRPILVSLATLLPSGRIQVTPVWADYDGSHIRVNTATARKKYQHMRERPQVTVMAMDPKNPGRYIEVRGRVARLSEEGADAHIDKLANDYMGQERYPFHQPDETRVICYVEPLRVRTQG